ncbi:MAG: hypothetical protein R6W75_00130 [Smithellaceae bacterium]
MLMLTHTYLLQQMIGDLDVRHREPDIYIYNIAPDLLTIHPDIDSFKTHSIKRFIQAPPDHPRAAYVMFHLLVDDLAHYGHISMECREGFNPDSAGYSYIKGRGLITPLRDLHKLISRDISYDEAAYRSHLIIEMIYDLVILSHIHANRSIELLEEAVQFTLDKKANEFSNDIAWLYGIDKEAIRDVLKNAASYITKERMDRIMNIEGRIRLFTDKFGLRNDNAKFTEAIHTLFQEALHSIGNEDFLQQTAVAVRQSGWQPTD